MEVEFFLALLAGLVGYVAGLAAHVESWMPAALLRNIDPDVVATEAKVLFLIPRSRFQELVLVVRCVRIMALHAIAHRGAVDRALDVRGVFIRMAGQAQAGRSGRD